MTYCLAIAVNDGLVFVSDSRTNAGVDQVSVYSKMHRFFGDGERMLTVLAAGNLATSQAVLRQLRRDIDENAATNLKSVKHVSEAADYIGHVSQQAQRKHRGAKDSSFDPGASFIVGGQISGRAPQIFLVYPEGNHIRASGSTPFLQIGELKYGKPILDRIVEPDLDLETAARCALVSMDSTLRSNITVGPPVELLIYHKNTLHGGEHMRFEEDDEYLRELRTVWQDNLKQAFESLPRLPKSSRVAEVRRIDRSGDS
jgi:putative proteasome-type protease